MVSEYYSFLDSGLDERAAMIRDIYDPISEQLLSFQSEFSKWMQPYVVEAL